jgi:cytochrome b561
MTENQTKTKNRTKIKLVIDVLIFIAFLIAMDPRSSGVTIHEWLATSLIAVLVVHVLLSWDWIARLTRRFIGKINNQSRINYILNWSLFIDGSVIMLSGFMISESVLPFLGLSLPRNFAWRGLHELSTNLFLVLLGLHTALHWSWIVDAFKRYVFQPLARISSPKPGKDLTA